MLATPEIGELRESLLMAVIDAHARTRFMKNCVACALMVGSALLTVPVTGRGDPGSSIRVGTPAPVAFPSAPLLRRPQPLSQAPAYDSEVRPASFVPAAPTFRAKLDIPRALPGPAVGLLPVMQAEPPEAGPPKSEAIPLMPKRLGDSVQEEFRTPEPTPIQPLPDSGVMPYADGTPQTTDGGIVTYPQSGQPTPSPTVVYSGSPVPVGDCCCNTANICDPCACCDNCCCTPCCNTCCWQKPCWNWWRNGCGGCGCCDCYPRHNGWVSAEFLYLNFSDQNVPPLVTTGPQGGFGIIGDPGTRVIYGEDQLNSHTLHPGLRLSVGKWFSSNPCWGIDASGFLIFRDHGTFTAASGGDPLIARPFINAGTGLQDSILVAKLPAGAFPGVRGSITVRDDTRLYGFDTNLRRKWLCGCCYHWDVLVGYRQVQLDEGIEIDDFEANTLPDGAGNSLTAIAHDRFRTRNTFHGGQIGLDGEYRIGSRWSIGALMKVAFGSMHQNLSVVGFTDITETTAAGVSTQARGSGGILALNSNIGSFRRDRFAVVPEVQLKLNYQLNQYCKVFVGYNMLFMSSVIRPGDQIDSTIDPGQIPTIGNPNPAPLARPAVLFATTPFFAHGVSAGLLCNY